MLAAEAREIQRAESKMHLGKTFYDADGLPYTQF